MSEKRRDSKGRVLRNGESQRKDGRYAYKYIDLDGSTRFIYSWRLVSSDTLPAGKKSDKSLREKEQEIKDMLEDGLHTADSTMTVLQLVKKYVRQKSGVRVSTKTGYQTVINFLAKDPFGKKAISSIKISDAKTWLIELQQNGKGYSSIHSIRGVLRPAFQMAVDDDIIRKNPFEFQLATVVVNDSVTREAITRKQERAFLQFVKEDKHFGKYYEGIYILFKTGMRISEFCGLTVSDIDLENRTIRIDHQLQRTSTMDYIIVPTKTNAGTRILPMTDEVYACFQKLIKNRKPPKVEPMIEGKSGFLYFNANGKPMVEMEWAKKFQYIREKYNRIYKVPMPKITPHICRHTYCSNMAKSGMNPKTLQYLMGHSEIGVTLNTYTHITFEDAKSELEKVSNQD